VIDDAEENTLADPEIARILKNYVVEQRHKSLRDARFVTEKGRKKDGKRLLPQARRDIATMIAPFIGGKKRRNTRKKHRKKNSRKKKHTRKRK
jgi:hypothetical protein